MRYEDVRSLIKTGDILACEGMEIYSHIIRQWGGFQNWLWKGKWVGDQITHIGIAIWIRLRHSDVDRLCILEAHAFKGVRLNPFDKVIQDYWRKGGKVHWQKLKSSLEGDKVAASGLTNWTKAYPSLYQFLIAGTKHSQWLRRELGMPIDIDEDAFHCSELVTRSLIDAGYPYDGEPAAVTPQMVSDFDCLYERVELKA